MKRNAFLILLILCGVLYAICAYAGGPSDRISNAPVPGYPTADNGWSFPGPVAIGTAYVPDLRSGVSPFQITANTVLTTTETDGRVYYISDATARTIQLPTLTSSTWQGKAVYFTDGRPDSGLTPWCSGTSLWYGSGAQSGTGTTLFVNAGSGNSNYTVGFIGALRNGAPVWKQLPADLTWFTLP